MDDRSKLEKRVADLLPICRAGGLPVEPEDFDLDAFDAARKELESDGVILALHEIDIRFMLEHACLCRINNAREQFDIKAMLRHEKQLAQRDTGLVYRMDPNTGHLVCHTVDWSKVSHVVAENSVATISLDWESIEDRQAWALGKYTLETLFGRKPQSDKMALSNDFDGDHE